MFKNWKTTLTGLLTGGPVLVCQLFHVCSVGHIGNIDFLTLISGVGAILTGAFAKDHNVSGGDTN